VTAPGPLWDFDDPSGSEARFRAAAATADAPDRLVLLTQVARALGLQGRYDDGHAVLDDLAVTDPEVATRVSLERGRLLRSAGAVDESVPHFEAAATSARRSHLEALHVDALHMLALVAPPGEALDRHHDALAVARASSSQEARDWDASLLNNIGMTHAEAEDWGAALAAFEDALEARRRIGDDARTRVARWMVGWALRNLGHREAALEVQTALKAELDAVGEEDPYVDEELALLRGPPVA
jgi:tetratricopeptide (TPR) repeat protein